MVIEYIINSMIKFEVNENRLTSTKTNNVEFLSETASRLLAYLIENNNHVVSRDDILSNVFEEGGISSTYSNLSRNIMLLRKALNTLGANDDCIITVPKLGFKLTGNIETANGLSDIKKINKIHYLTALILTAVIVFVLLTTYLLISNRSYTAENSMPMIAFDKTIKIKKCSIHYIHDSEYVDPIKMFEFIENNGHRVDCNEENTFFYWSQKNSATTRLFVAYCNAGHCRGAYEYQMD